MRPGLPLLAAGLGLAAAGVTRAANAADPPPAAAPDRAAGATVTETIDETTVGDLDGIRVPMGNMTPGTYTLPDGTERKWLICSLVLPGGGPGVFVGEGSEVTVGESRWRVIAVVKPAGELGSVTLQKL